MSDIDEKIMNRIKKLQALAERGVGGEKTSAQEFLEKLMTKYNISEDNLQEDKKDFYDFNYYTAIERKLLGQIIFKVTNGGYVYRSYGKTLSAECSLADKMEIEYLFNFYKKAFQEEFDLFYQAFLSKNRLYPDDVKVIYPETEAEMEELLKMEMMMRGMNVHTPNKLIGTEND